MEQQIPQDQRFSRILRAVARQFIPNIGTLLLIALLLWAQQAGAFPFHRGQPQAAAPNALPEIITYQGKLTDAGGNPVTSSVAMTFALYNVASGGTALWSESYSGGNTVPVQEGEFTVRLGSGNPLPTDIWEQDSLYLGIAVGSDGEMAPREVLSAVPVAVQAGVALTVPDGSITTEKLALSYDGYGTWIGPDDIQGIVGPGWFDVASPNYRNLSITVSRDAILDVAVTAVMLTTSNRGGYKIYLDGNEIGYGAYTSANQWTPVPVRMLLPVTAGTHTIAIKIGSWDVATVDMEGSFYFNVLAYGR